ncbi:MAG: rhomboid family intramembrane serine protease [Solirubrobacterales bacterium]
MAEVCYRHPNRETNVSCSRCGRPICPECMYDSPVGMRCPECAGERTRARTLPIRRSDTPYATYALIAINVIVFIAEIGGGGGAAGLEGGGPLIADGGLLGPAISDGGEWYRIVTSGFLHAGPLHLFLNMFVLYILGTILEEGIGTVRMLGIYFVSLLAGSFGALLLDPDQLTVGASGAVYGIMAATFLVARRRGVEQLASQVGLWVILNLAFTFAVPGISIGGHIGGLLGGAAAAAVILAGERRRGAIGFEALGLALIAAVSVGGALLAASSSGTPGVG